MILSRLSTKEAVKTSTLSKRWEHVWKQISHIVFHLPKIINSTELLDSSNRVDNLISKVINNHNGHLESCVINYSPFHGISGACVENIGAPLKIENNNLKFFSVLSSYNIGGLKVSSTSLHILVLQNTYFGKNDFFLGSPKLQFNRNFWVAGRFAPHFSYNISKEEKSIVHEEFVNNISGGFCNSISFVTASVSIDLMNRTEVERLRQVLRLWIRKMKAIEIVFKNNNNAPREENESWDRKLWEEEDINKDPFPNAKFRVETVWMSNFSGSEEEFAFASRLIRQGTVVDKLMIKTTSLPAMKKLGIEAAVVKLRALQTEGQRELTIECF